ncbi:MAG: galactose mutarotase [Spirochaetes bacterium]|nr:galactose mutarotase [Spirochaetota bacterium]
MKKWISFSVVLLLGTSFLIASGAKEFPVLKHDYVEIKRENYVKTIDGKEVDLYTIQNRKGTLIAKITNYGAKIEQLLVPDRNGFMGDVVQGYESIDKAVIGQPSMGAFIGRYANRIGKARFTLDGKEYQLAKNNGENCLHGGQKGSRFCVFDAKQLDDSSVEMFYTFQDGEENFPGKLALRVLYTVTDQDELVVDYQSYAVDKNTVASFTTHSFFNLSGNLGSSILDHVIQVNADYFLPIDSNLIPTGEARNVTNTVMDFRVPTTFGARIQTDYDQLKLANGYDHHYVLNKKNPNGFEFAASAWDPKTGRYMEVWTTEPGMQLHTGNNLAGQEPRDVGKGAKFVFRSGFNMEPSRFPDSPNKPHFPTTVVKAGEWYTGKTVYRFSVK